MAGVGAASADDSAAVFFNPALLAGAGTNELFMMGVATRENLTIAGQAVAVDSMSGYAMGFRARLGHRIGMGALLHMPSGGLARAGIRSPGEPRLALYDMRHDVLQLALGLGAQITSEINAGLGVRITAGGGVTSPSSIYISNYDDPEQDDPDFRYSEVAVSAQFDPEWALTAGVSWQPTPQWRAGMTFRDELYMPLDSSILIDVEIGGLIRVSVPLRVTGTLYYEPREWALAARYEPESRWLLAVELRRIEWSGYRDPRAEIEIGETDVNIPLFREYPPADFHDIWSPAVAGRYAIHRQADLYAGYAFVPAAAAAQTGDANLMDNAKHVIATGIEAMIELPPSLGLPPLILGAAGQFQHFIERENTKSDSQTFTAKGSLLHGGLSLRMEF